MRIWSFILIGFFAASSLTAQAVPSLFPSPENEYFINFLIPSRAEQMFGAAENSPARIAADTYYQNFIVPRFQVSGSDQIRIQDVEGMIQTWSPEAQARTLTASDIREWLPKYDRPQELSAKQKAILTSVVGLEIIQNLRFPNSSEDVFLLRSFYDQIESDPRLLETYLELDVFYASEKLDDIDIWREQNQNAPKKAPYAEKDLSELSLKEMAEIISWIRAQEEATQYWGNDTSKATLIEQFIAKEVWGELTSKQLHQLDQNTDIYKEERFASESERAWQKGLWNPLNADASLTRSPILFGTSWALFHMVRGIKAPISFAQPMSIFLRQMGESSFLSPGEIKKYIEHSGKDLYPKELRDLKNSPLRKPDFRESFKGARRLHLEQRRLSEIAGRAFGGAEAEAKFGNFMAAQVLGANVDLAESRKVLCHAELALINQGGMKLGIARRLIQRRLVDMRRSLADQTNLKKKTREFMEAEFGVKNKWWNYLPFRLQRRLRFLARNPNFQIQNGVTSLPSSLRGGWRSWNPFYGLQNIQAGAKFGNILPMEFSPASLTAVLGRRFGWSFLAAGGAAALSDSFMFLDHFVTPQPTTDQVDENENKILKEILSDLESDLQIQTWSVENLTKNLKAIELRVSAQRRKEGLPPVTIYVDPRSTTAPERTSGRVATFFAVIAPVHADQRLNWRALDEALLVRFDSTWEPASAERPNELKSASWKLGVIYDMAKAQDQTRRDFKSSIGIERSQVLWVDAGEANRFITQDSAGVVYQAPVKKWDD